MSRYLTDYCSSNLTLMAKRYASDETKVILMLKELRLIKERKRKKETMATGYYIHGRSAGLEAVERWENEGGGLSQTHDYVLDSPGENYLRHKDQSMAIGRDSLNAMLLTRNPMPDGYRSSIANRRCLIGFRGLII